MLKAEFNKANKHKLRELYSFQPNALELHVPVLFRLCGDTMCRKNFS